MLNLKPLNVLGERELGFMPPHFMKTTVQKSLFWEVDNSLKDWITAKLNGRYCVTIMPNVSDENKFEQTLMVGFEEHKEMTYFLLACPHIRRN